MTTVIRRRGPFFALLAVLGLVLTACASGPSQVNAAAIVGGKAIAVNRVQQLVDRALEIEPATRTLADQRKLDLLSRGMLRQLVLHELIESYAAKHRLTVESADVTELARQLRELEPLPTDGTVPPTALVQQAVNRAFDPEAIARDHLLMTKIGQAQAATLAVTFDFILIAPGGAGGAGSLRAQAVDKARELAQGLDQAGKILDAEIAGGAQAAKNETISPAQAPEIADSALFGTPANSVVAFQPGDENAGWVVALVRERDTKAKPAAEAPAPDARLSTALGPRLLQSTVADLGVKISPRYGLWDLAGMTVAPSEGETKGVVIPVKNAPVAP
ncbi:SurA N-terminal domain-containing protein [Actinokineospora iranica]|uniref:SurA N-terminal domain-containing protein n=1 Tax=Actinokineospora iranica TaxID=1271860 RepID=A0A1G6RG33_9PSEU|nr:hypothetical protein [Actinokineospora iranica]SDD03353.1 hypothetical protein SAMN05216174_106323 [Actinokineospora iranica]